MCLRAKWPCGTLHIARIQPFLLRLCHHIQAFRFALDNQSDQSTTQACPSDVAQNTSSKPTLLNPHLTSFQSVERLFGMALSNVWWMFDRAHDVDEI